MAFVRAIVVSLVFLLPRLAVAQPPANDDFESRIDLGSSLPVNTSGSNLDATEEPGEPIPPGRASGSIWWTWNAPADGRYRFDATGVDFNAAIVVYTGSELTSLTEIGSNVVGGSPLIDATPGLICQVQVLGFFGGAGSVSLQIADVPTPRYEFRFAESLGGSAYSYSGHLTTDGTIDDNLTADNITGWELTIITPGEVDGVTEQKLTPANSAVAFDRAESEARLSASSGQLWIRSAGGQFGADERSSLSFSGEGVSLVFFGGNALHSPTALVSDESEDPPSFLEEFPLPISAPLVVAASPVFIEVQRPANGGGIEIDFVGILQQSGDLLQWEDVDPQPTSPYSPDLGLIQQYFRSVQDLTVPD